MKWYFFVLFVGVCACNSAEKEVLESQKVDLREFLYEDSVYYFVIPNLRIRTGTVFDKFLDHQDSLIDLLPEASSDLALLCYFNSLFDTLIINNEHDSFELSPLYNYRLATASSAIAIAVSSISVLQANQPFTMHLNPQSMRFSFGKNPLYLSMAIILIGSSSSYSSLNNSSLEERNENLLVESIPKIFAYYGHFFQLDSNVETLVKNTVRIIDILKRKGLVTSLTRIKEDYFLDCLLEANEISTVEKKMYKLLTSNFKNDLYDDFKFDRWRAIQQIEKTTSQIVANVNLLEGRLSHLENRDLSDSSYIHKATRLVGDIKNRYKL